MDGVTWGQMFTRVKLISLIFVNKFRMADRMNSCRHQKSSSINNSNKSQVIMFYKLHKNYTRVKPISKQSDFCANQT